MFERLKSLLPKNAWRTYASSIGAKFVDGGFLHSDQIIIERNFYSINIRLGTNQRGNPGFRYTRLRCAYTAENPLYFSIQKLDSVTKILLKQTDVNSGQLIAHKFNLSSNAITTLQFILVQDDHLWKLLDDFNLYKFSSEKDDGLYGPVFPQNEHQLCLETLGEMKDPQEFDKAINILDHTMAVLLQFGHLSPQRTTIAY